MAGEVADEWMLRKNSLSTATLAIPIKCTVQWSSKIMPRFSLH